MCFHEWNPSYNLKPEQVNTRPKTGYDQHTSSISPERQLSTFDPHYISTTQVQVKFKFGDLEDLKIFQSVQLLSSSYNSIMILNCPSCECFFNPEEKKYTKSTKTVRIYLIFLPYLEISINRTNDGWSKWHWCLCGCRTVSLWKTLHILLITLMFFNL